MEKATTLQVWGALGFGALIGWYVYYINRYRRAEVQLTDIVTLIGAVGGAAVLALFPAKSDLFGAYGIGLATGFFSYFIFLLGFVAVSKAHGVAWFLDGRSKCPADDECLPGQKGLLDQKPLEAAGGDAVANP